MNPRPTPRPRSARLGRRGSVDRSCRLGGGCQAAAGGGGGPGWWRTTGGGGLGGGLWTVARGGWMRGARWGVCVGERGGGVGVPGRNQPGVRARTAGMGPILQRLEVGLGVGVVVGRGTCGLEWVLVTPRSARQERDRVWTPSRNRCRRGWSTGGTGVVSATHRFARRARGTGGGAQHRHRRDGGGGGGGGYAGVRCR